MYADFTNDIIKASGSKFSEKDFWLWLDAQLQECCAKYSQILDENKCRAKFNGWAFLMLLNKTHFWLFIILQCLQASIDSAQIYIPAQV